MDLKEHIGEIQADLRAGRFPNEASVSQGIVLRILQVLGWPVFDSRVVWPQYSVEGGRVDYALCHPKSKPLVFIEVKQVGQGEGADRQLFEYAFHCGVPMAILTTGQEWHFYLPAEAGHYEERKVYKIDLLESDMDESSHRFNRYLSYKSVCSGESMECARKDYKDVARKREIKDNLPIAWQKLIEEQDSLLCDLLAEKVESLCGYKPDTDMISDFLSGLDTKPVSPTQPKRQKRVIGGGTRPPKEGFVGYVLHGREVQARNARDVFIKVMEELSKEDPSFCERFASRPRHGAKRRYIARTKEELYPGRPDLCDSNSYRLSSGWWVGTNYSKRDISKRLEMACEVAGLRFGKDLVVYLGD